MPEPILKVLTKKSQLETSVTIHADMIPKCLLHEKKSIRKSSVLQDSISGLGGQVCS